MAPTPIATYEEIKDLPNHPEKLLIDVRESDELLGGKIPTSINIPCESFIFIQSSSSQTRKNQFILVGQVIERLSPETSAEQFQKMFGIRKPSLDSQIIFYCQIGKRSDRAGRMAIDLGYKNVKNYLGSWAEYSKAV